MTEKGENVRLHVTDHSSDNPPSMHGPTVQMHLHYCLDIDTYCTLPRWTFSECSKPLQRHSLTATKGHPYHRHEHSSTHNVSQSGRRSKTRDCLHTKNHATYHWTRETTPLCLETYHLQPPQMNRLHMAIANRTNHLARTKPDRLVCTRMDNLDWERSTRCIVHIFLGEVYLVQEAQSDQYYHPGAFQKLVHCSFE